MSWIYQGKKFTETNIPKNGIGFIYHMSVILNGNTYAYIGKKNFFSNVKKKLGKKALALVTDKRLKKYTKEQKTVRRQALGQYFWHSYFYEDSLLNTFNFCSTTCFMASFASLSTL